MTEKQTGKFQFQKPVRRLNTRKKIEGILKLPKTRGSTWNSKYYGEVNGVEVRIDFSLDHSSVLYAKSPEDLTQAYNYIIMRV